MIDKKNSIKKSIGDKQIAVKKIRIKVNIKIKLNKILNDKIKNKIKSNDWKQNIHQSKY